MNYEFPPIGGGASRASFCIARELVRLGHRVVVVTSRYGKTAAEQEVHGIEVHRVPSWRKGIHDCGLRGAVTFIFSALPRLRRLLGENRFDIVHYFFGLPTGILAAYTHGVRNLPYIISLRGSDVPDYDRASKKLRLMHRCTLALSHRIWRNAAKVVAVSDSLRSLGQTAFPNVEIGVIHNGVDESSMRVTNNGEARKRIRLLTVSRLIPRKGIGDLMRAVERLQNVDVELRIAGSGHAERQLKALAAELGLDDRVEFLGYQSEAEVRRLYAAADLFVLPTRSDAFANVILEAMSAGLPVIATDVGGAREAIEHGVNGLLIKPYDPDAMAAAISRLADNPVLRRSMSEANIDRIRWQFTWPTIARQYCDTYGKALETAAPGTA